MNRSWTPVTEPRPRGGVPYHAALEPLIADARGSYDNGQDLIVAVLRRGILEGLVPPDTRFRQRDIAWAFGTGRIPAREALRLLEVEGLLESAPYRGYTIVTLDADAIEEVYEMRAALETLAVGLAVPLLTDEDVADLRRIREEVACETDPARRLEGCERFHFRLYAVTGRPRLVGTIRRLRQEVVRSFRWHVVQHGTEHHDAFFAAVLAGDAEVASDTLAAHYRKVSALMRRYMRDPLPAG